MRVKSFERQKSQKTFSVTTTLKKKEVKSVV